MCLWLQLCAVCKHGSPVCSTRSSLAAQQHRLSSPHSAMACKPPAAEHRRRASRQQSTGGTCVAAAHLHVADEAVGGQGRVAWQRGGARHAAEHAPAKDDRGNARAASGGTQGRQRRGRRGSQCERRAAGGPRTAAARSRLQAARAGQAVQSVLLSMLVQCMLMQCAHLKLRRLVSLGLTALASANRKSCGGRASAGGRRQAAWCVCAHPACAAICNNAETKTSPTHNRQGEATDGSTSKQPTNTRKDSLRSFKNTARGARQSPRSRRSRRRAA